MGAGKNEKKVINESSVSQNVKLDGMSTQLLIEGCRNTHKSSIKMSICELFKLIRKKLKFRNKETMSKWSRE